MEYFLLSGRCCPSWDSTIKVGWMNAWLACNRQHPNCPIRTLLKTACHTSNVPKHHKTIQLSHCIQITRQSFKKGTSKRASDLIAFVFTMFTYRCTSFCEINNITRTLPLFYHLFSTTIFEHYSCYNRRKIFYSCLHILWLVSLLWILSMVRFFFTMVGCVPAGRPCRHHNGQTDCRNHRFIYIVIQRVSRMPIDYFIRNMAHTLFFSQFLSI